MIMPMISSIYDGKWDRAAKYFVQMSSARITPERLLTFADLQQPTEQPA